MRRCNLYNPPLDWDDIASQGIQKWKGKSLRADICKLVFNALIYNIWRNRNETRYGSHPKTEEQMPERMKLFVTIEISDWKF